MWVHAVWVSAGMLHWLRLSLTYLSVSLTYLSDATIYKVIESTRKKTHTGM